jgi:hypothetical protein
MKNMPALPDMACQPVVEQGCLGIEKMLIEVLCGSMGNLGYVSVSST